jgi:citrate synthase
MDSVDQRGFDNQRSDLLDARGASRFLGVKVATLYAYASRGLVRSEAGVKGRGRRYVRSDLERLKQRGLARSGHGPVAAGALRFGEPVLSTAISSITPDGPTYRGENAIALGRAGHRFEAVAELLWSGALPRDGTRQNPLPHDETRRTEGPLGTSRAVGLAVDRAWAGEEAAALVQKLGRAVPVGHPPLVTLLAAVPRLALLDDDRFSAPPEAEWARARRLARAMALILSRSHEKDTRKDHGKESGRAASAETMSDAVCLALGKAPSRAREAINLVLVLTADHELNASTFAARVVASTGADLYACVTGALAALSGPRHGALSDRVEALLDEVGDPRRARDVVALRSSRGERIPGFGHPLYPDGDPRVPPLLEMAREVAGKRSLPDLELALSIASAMERSGRERPNLDFGLVAVVRALGLPRGSGAGLFALGRTAGWVAHALEQRDAGYLLRPRAEYVGK